MRLIKIIFWIIFFSIFYLNTNALNIEINTDKNNVSVWDVFDLNIEIEWNVSSDFNLWEIKWLENFEVVNRSQSQSSASKVAVINWKTRSESKTIYNIHYTLQANKKWDFTIWPITLTNSGSNISTTPVNINVAWWWLFWWNKTWNNNTIANYSYKNNFDVFFDEKRPSNDIIIDTKKDNYFYDFINIVKNLFFVILAFVPLFLLFYYFKNKDKFNWINLDIIKEKLFSKSINYEDIKYVDTIEEKEELSEDVYPSKYDKNFIHKLEDIFRNKIKNKYKLEDIKNKTYIDILWELENIEIYDKEKIKMLSNLFNKAKYSKIWVNKEELIDLVRNI